MTHWGEKKGKHQKLNPSQICFRGLWGSLLGSSMEPFQRVCGVWAVG